LLLGAVYVRTACVAVVPTKVTEDSCPIAGTIVLATVRQIAVLLRFAEPNAVLRLRTRDIITISSPTPRQAAVGFGTIVAQRPYSNQEWYLRPSVRATQLRLAGIDPSVPVQREMEK
jgi:hypothetical protein